MDFHKQAHQAAQAAHCAKDQGKFWEYHDKLFANQRSLQPENLKQYAVDLELNAEKFNECLDSEKYKDLVDREVTDGSSFGVRGTPAVFINGRFISGAKPFEEFKTIVDEELERKGVK